jgi:hypothetical protein
MQTNERRLMNIAQHSRIATFLAVLALGAACATSGGPDPDALPPEDMTVDYGSVQMIATPAPPKSEPQQPVSILRTETTKTDGPLTEPVAMQQDSNSTRGTPNPSSSLHQPATKPDHAVPSEGRPNHTEDLLLQFPGVSLALGWQPAAANEPAFWCAKSPVNASLWRSVVSQPKFSVKDENGGFLELSWNNAVAFCEELTQRERLAGRLPTGHIYSLPTQTQLERVAGPDRNVNGFSAGWLWTLDADGMDSGTRELQHVIISVDGKRHRWSLRQSILPTGGVGFVVVLTPHDG